MSSSLLSSGSRLPTFGRGYIQRRGVDVPLLFEGVLEAQAARKARESHGPAQRQWRCSVCTQIFPTKQGVAIHFAGVHPRTVHHPNIVSGSASDDGDEEPETYTCSYCDRSLPSQQGLRNHERRWHQGVVSARLA